MSRSKKDTFWFAHDYEPTNDPKIQAMMADYGGLGYGIYWRIIEMLHSDAEHQLPFKRYIYSAIAKQLSTNANTCSTKMNKIKQPDLSAEQVEIFIQDCILDYELFHSNSDFFWSNRVHRNIEDKKDISEKRSKAGKESAEARKKQALAQQEAANAEQVLTSVEQDATITGQDRTIQDTIVPNNPTTATATISVPITVGAAAAAAIATQSEIGSERTQVVAREVWNDQIWREQICMGRSLTTDHLQKWMSRFNASICNDTVEGFDHKKYKKMFQGWLAKRLSQGDSVETPNGPVKTSNAAPLKRATA